MKERTMDFGYDDVIEHFSRIWPVHVEEFGELLVALRRHFGGDLDLMLVLAIIGSRTLPRRRVQDMTYGEFKAGLAKGREPSVINVQSIAACTGIPRETVRRKVTRLEEKGWVERGDGGSLVATRQAARDLEPMTEASMRYLAHVGAACVEVASSRQCADRADP
jgi:hypothetical protein